MSQSDAPIVAAPSKRRDLTVGPVFSTLFAFALPSLGVNILQSINGSINSIWIGHSLGEAALVASSNAGQIMFLMFGTLFGFAMATTVLIGQQMGRRDIEAVRRTLGSALALFVVAGTVTATLGWIFAPNLLHALATPTDAYPLALSYLRVIFLGMPSTFVMILLTSSLRGVGDSITPLWNAILNVSLDIVLNPIFILGLGPIPALGIAGSALATLIAGVVSVAVLIYRIYAKDLPIRLRGAELAWLRPHADVVKTIVAIGFPMGASMIVMAGSMLVLIGLVNREGVDTTAAFGVMNQLWSYVQMPAVAVGSAVSAMAAQNIGAQKWDRLSRITWAGIGINTLMSFVLIVGITIFARPLMELFLPADSPAIPIGIHMNSIVAWIYLMMGVSMVVTSVVRANGAVVVPFILLIISAVIVRFSFAFGLYPTWRAEAIWWSSVASGTVSMVLSLAYYFHGGWRKKRLETGIAPAVLPTPEPA
ncbi:MAG: MATE family efflux transporter [Sphingomonas sp.]